MVRGKHFLQFGFDYIDQEYNQKQFNNENDFFTFGGTYTGYLVADLLLGAPTTLTQFNGGAGALLHLRQHAVRGTYTRSIPLSRRYLRMAVACTNPGQPKLCDQQNTSGLSTASLIAFETKRQASLNI